jgi:hypothetical protein
MCEDCSSCRTHCCCMIIVIIPPHTPPRKEGGAATGVLGEKSWGRRMLVFIGNSIKASLSKQHLVERCNLCSTCSMPATILARMHRFQNKAATEIDDNNSPGCMIFCLSLQTLFMLCGRCIFCLICVLARKQREQGFFWRSMAECMQLTCENCNQYDFSYVTQ